MSPAPHLSRSERTPFDIFAPQRIVEAGSPSKPSTGAFGGGPRTKSCTNVKRWWLHPCQAMRLQAAESRRRTEWLRCLDYELSNRKYLNLTEARPLFLDEYGLQSTSVGAEGRRRGPNPALRPRYSGKYSPRWPRYRPLGDQSPGRRLRAHPPSSSRVCPSSLPFPDRLFYYCEWVEVWYGGHYWNAPK